ncbi:agmatine deiminase family protein [Streptomyces sp. NPDC048483]|uniref:agmatine deiminase family protein n=1 Tax=Streptomyces sp. NPDC048483 TaxID=3154927 RepID=UPI00341FC630
MTELPYGAGAGAGAAGAWAMPAETVPHARTYLAWPPAGSVWGADTPAVQQDIARLARTIAAYEPVTLLAAPAEERRARKACGAAGPDGSGVEIMPVPVDDLWVRDSGPVFVTGPGGVAGVDLGFNGWGGKQDHPRDSQVARRLLECAGRLRIPAGITAEGGSLEADGEGTLLATESSLVNPNRNPGRSRTDIEQALRQALGVRTVIWTEGVRGEDITDCHIDALARFAEPGVVVLGSPAPDAPPVWQRVHEQARTALEQATDAAGRRLRLIDLPDASEAGRRGPEFLGSYVNYYVANGAVIVPRFGDRTADDRAAGTLRELYPGREIRQIPVDMIAEGGGGIHCATQQEPVG